MVGITDEGAFIYQYKNGGYATTTDFDEFDHENDILDYHIEPVWIIDENGEFDLDFLQDSNHIHADVFSDVLGDYFDEPIIINIMEDFINYFELKEVLDNGKERVSV